MGRYGNEDVWSLSSGNSQTGTEVSKWFQSVRNMYVKWSWSLKMCLPSPNLSLLNQKRHVKLQLNHGEWLWTCQATKIWKKAFQYNNIEIAGTRCGEMREHPCIKGLTNTLILLQDNICGAENAVNAELLRMLECHKSSFSPYVIGILGNILNRYDMTIKYYGAIFIVKEDLGELRQVAGLYKRDHMQ